jgi:hypothetical protein
MRLRKEFLMSHIVEIQTEVRDPVAVQRACQQLKLPEPRWDWFRLFAGEVEGLGVELPGWRYPVVCQTPTGRLQYDNYNGRWGEPAKLDQFLQRYAVEKAALEARKQGHSVTERALQDGSIKLTIQVGGAA